MTIKELAKVSGRTVSQIKYYLSKGKLKGGKHYTLLDAHIKKKYDFNAEAVIAVQAIKEVRRGQKCAR